MMVDQYLKLLPNMSFLFEFQISGSQVHFMVDFHFPKLVKLLHFSIFKYCNFSRNGVKEKTASKRRSKIKKKEAFKHNEL